MGTMSVEDLEVFKLGHALVLQVYEVTRSFPRDETFGLVTQLRRAAASVVANLVEAAGRLNRAEYRQCGVPCKDGDLQWVRVPPGNWSLQPEAVGARGEVVTTRAETLR